MKILSKTGTALAVILFIAMPLIEQFVYPVSEGIEFWTGVVGWTIVKSVYLLLSGWGLWSLVRWCGVFGEEKSKDVIIHWNKISETM